MSSVMTFTPAQKFYKSGTPITETVNPRSGIVKGITARKPSPRKASVREPAANKAARLPGPHNVPPGGICPCNLGFFHPPGTSVNDPPPLPDPNDIPTIEKFFASGKQNVLMVRKMRVKKLVYNPPPLSSQLPSNSKKQRKAAGAEDVGGLQLDPAPEVEVPDPNPIESKPATEQIDSSQAQEIPHDVELSSSQPSNVNDKSLEDNSETLSPVMQ